MIGQFRSVNVRADNVIVVPGGGTPYIPPFISISSFREFFLIMNSRIPCSDSPRKLHNDPKLS